MCWTCSSCQAEHLECLLKQSEKLHFSPGLHIPILQLAFTHISLNWALIELGHFQTIVSQDLATPNRLSCCKGWSWPKLAGVRVVTKEPPKSRSSPRSEHKDKQEKKKNPFFVPTELQMDQKDSCGLWKGKNLVISHQHYLFQFCLHRILMKHCSGEAAPGWAQESPSTWAGTSAGTEEQAGGAERGDQRSLWLSWQSVLRLRIFAENGEKPL